MPLSQPDLAPARGPDAVDRIVAVASRSKEEVDSRRRRRAAASDREQQGQKYDDEADAGRLRVLFVLDRLDAEITALELRARRQLARRRLGCDLAGDHDQLAIRE
jgi:hypothetical protein